jgi:hypothetical protein
MGPWLGWIFVVSSLPVRYKLVGDLATLPVNSAL